MKTVNVIHLIVGIIVGLALALFAALTYWDAKPNVKATGEYATWEAPPTPEGALSVSGSRSYARLDIRNEGSAEAKEIKLRTPFRGSYRLNSEGVLQQFTESITLPDLNPGEGHIVEVWSETSRAQIYSDDVNITHTRGTATVDFGTKIYGSFFPHLMRWGLAYLIFVIFGLLFVATFLYEHWKKARI